MSTPLTMFPDLNTFLAKVPVQQVFIIPGALAANHVFDFVMPINVELSHVSFCNASANAGTLKIGSAADDDEFMADTAFGVSGTPAESDIDVGEEPAISAGTAVKITITDHESHMSDVCVVLTLLVS